MDYKEKYEMALEGLQEILSSGEDSIKMSRLQLRLQGIFPELKESKDEKIRRNIVAALKGEGYYDCDLTNECIAWLEKQGEHAKFRDSIQVGDKVTRNEDGVLVNLSQLKRVAKKDEKRGEKKPAWSEEDEAMWVEISDLLWEGYKQSDSTFSWDDIRNWVIPKLKFLKDRVQPQNTWKPSDEQIKVLEFFIPYVTQCSIVLQKSKDTLLSLLSDLKKLKG